MYDDMYYDQTGAA
jgi:hypothetical protein